MKLTRRQLNHLIMESLNLQEDRVPGTRKLMRRIDDYEKRINTLISALDDPEKASERKESEKELKKYLSRLKAATDTEGPAISSAKKTKAMKIRDKVEDAMLKLYMTGDKDEPTTGSETAAQTPSGESEPKGKKTSKTRAERKTARRYRASRAYLDAATAISGTISKLTKQLKDETNKRRKKALADTISFLEGRLEKLKKGEDVTEEPIPPEVETTIERSITLGDPNATDTIKDLISGQVSSVEDVTNFLDSFPPPPEEPPTPTTENDPDEENENDPPNKGKETLNQTPSWSSNRGTTRLRKSGNITSSAASSSEIKGVGDVLAGKGKHDDKTLPGLPTFYVSTVEEWSNVNAKNVNNKGSVELGLKALYKFEDIPTSNAVAKFNSMGNETVAPGGKGLGSNMKNNFIYDDKEETLYYDSAGFTNYKVRNVELTPDGKHLRIKGLTNESRHYGKSHATLLRERYWGRY